MRRDRRQFALSLSPNKAAASEDAAVLLRRSVLQFEPEATPLK